MTSYEKLLQEAKEAYEDRVTRERKIPVQDLLDATLPKTGKE